jgi:2-polyprenyl-3-methyl-5-hydroxy-6-metoxy-1,4-benzoquinol methylase
MAQDALNPVCPVHQINLVPNDNDLTCTSGCTYPVRGKVPRFTTDLYTEAFGFQWGIWDRTQLDSYTGLSVTKDRLIEAFGPIGKSNLKNKNVLEVGCGAGRFTEILLSFDSIVYSIDHSNAVEVNERNFPLSDTHKVIQADIENLPFLDKSFDIVFCLGVIQHTPNPEKSIQYLFEKLKPGGWLVIDHYSKSVSWNLRTAPVFRLFLKRLEPEKSFTLVKRIFHFSCYFFRVSSNRYYRKICNIIFPIVYFDREIPGLSFELKKAWGLLDTYDSLTDWHKHRRSVASIRETLEKLGLTEIECFHNGSAVVARGRKI